MVTEKIKATVDILMATYNGESHVEDQIFSILSQSFSDFRLLIHDDGSTDNTVSIIKEIARSDSRVVLFEDHKTFQNPAQNFLHLVQLSDAEFVMFADQDDIWLNNKIEIMLNEIREKENHSPQIVYSNSYAWSENKGILGKTIFTFPERIENFLFLNGGQHGCMAIFNKQALNLMKKWTGECAMHDHILQLIGLSMGHVTYLKSCLMLYRQHEKNVTGKALLKEFDVKRLAKNRKAPVICQKHYNAVVKFSQTYELPESSKEILDIYISLPTLSFFKKIKTVIIWNFGLYDSKLKLLAKILVRPFMA